MPQFQLLAILFLILSFIAAWSTRRLSTVPIWVFPFAISVTLGFIGGALAPLSLAWIGLALFGFYAAKRWEKYAVWSFTALGFYVLVMGMNLLPGFNKIEVLSPRLLGESTTPFYLEFRLAKPITGLLILAFIAEKCGSLKEFFGDLKLAHKWALPTLGVIAVGVALGLAIDVKFFVWTPVFIVCNLFFSVIPEEAFFRGFLQQPLQNRFGKAIWIIPLMAVLFAAVHMAPPSIDPLKYYAVIGLAGACYAWAYRVKARIELAIASHALLNTIHFIFLTYPLSFT